MMWIVTIVIILIFASVYLLKNCEPEKKYSYDNLEHIYAEQIFTKGTKSNPEYYVYIYRTACSVCESLTKLVTEYYDDGKLPLYVINKADRVHNESLSGNDCNNAPSNNFMGATHYEQIKTCSTPILLLIRDGVVVAGYDTGASIKEALNEALGR